LPADEVYYEILKKRSHNIDDTCVIRKPVDNDSHKRKNKVTYSIVDSYHNLCLDKKDIIYAEIASDTLLKDVSQEEDKKTIELEIAALKTTLSLMT